MSKRVLVYAVALALAGPVSAGGGKSVSAQEFPGAMGWEMSGHKGGGLPVAVMFAPCSIPPDDGGCPAETPYATGPGGWGDWVSDCASEQGGFDPEACLGREIPH